MPVYTRFFAVFKKPITRSLGYGKRVTVAQRDDVPSDQSQEVYKAPVVVKLEAAPISDTQDDELKHLQALSDALHDPDFLNIRSCIELPIDAETIQEVDFMNPKDLVHYSKVVPHDRPIQYGQPESSVLSLAAPAEVGLSDFTFIKVLGSGASGLVYLVKHDLTKSLFALKKVEKGLLDAEELALVVQEQATLRKVRGQRQLLSLEASFHDRDHFYLITSFLPGGDLRAQLKKFGALPTDHIIFYAAQTILALEYLHSKGVVHRDIKPDNLLLDAAGNLQVCDFGLSKVFDMTQRDVRRGPNSFWTALTRAGQSNKSPASFTTRTCRGTPMYCAPEVFQEKPYSFEVDLWSLGVTIYELATGRTPFQHSNDLWETMQSVQGDPISFRVEDEVDPCVQLFIHDVLERKPEDRLSLKAMKNHRLFEKIDWRKLARQDMTPPWVPNTDSVLSDVAFSEENNICFRLPGTDPAVPDLYPRYTFASDLFFGAPSPALSSGTSSGSATASGSSVENASTCLPEAEAARPRRPNYLLKLRKLASSFATTSSSLSSSSLHHLLNTPSGDSSGPCSPSSPSASGSSPRLHSGSHSSRIALGAFSKSPSPSSARSTSKKPFSDLRRWAKMLRA